MTTYLLTEARKTAKACQGRLAPPPAERRSSPESRTIRRSFHKKMKKNLTLPQSAANLHPKLCSKSQINNSHLRKLMKKTFPHDARPTESQEEQRSLLHFAVPLRRLRLAMGGFSLALIFLSIPTATAQTNTTARKPNQDFDTSFAPKGIWSDGETTWVAKGGSNAKLYAYNSDTKSRDSSQDFTTLSDAGNIGPSGIWSDGTTMWVANSNGDNVDDPADKIYAYKMSDKSRDASEDFTLASGNFHPTGIWSDKTTMWVADTAADKLYAYKMSDKSRDGEKDIVISNLIGRRRGEWNPFIQGLWSDGTTIWASEFAGRKEDGSPKDIGHKIYAFKLSNNEERDATKDFNTLTAAGNRIPRDIWSDGKTMWVADSQDSKIYAYHALFFAARNPAQEFNTLKAARNTAPHGLSSNGQTLWVTDWSDHKLYAYDLATKQRDPTKDFDTLETAENTGPKGIWSNDTTMWVADWNADKLYAYNLATKQRDPTKDFNTLKAAGNTNPTGIWSNDTTMWVADTADRIYAYKMSDKSRDAAKDIDTNSLIGNRYIQGIWSDGTTLWAVDYTGQDNNVGNKIYAFNLSARTRDAAKDFETLNAAGNHRPRGLWSDGTTMWVMDDEDGKIYAYRLSDAASLSALTLTSKIPLSKTTFANRSLSLSPAFNGAIARYTASPVPYTSTNLTVSPTKLQPNATVSILPTDADTTTAGHQVNLAVGDNEVTITVTNPNSLPRTRTYTVNVHREFFTSHNLLHDFALVSSNSAPYGLWSDGKTMWVADIGQDKVFAYNWTTKQHDPAKDFTLASRNTAPRGIWSNEKTMWVADRDDDKIYAYKMSNKSRDTSKDFDTLKGAKNFEPRGIWSDGVTMWVSDETAGRIYAYKMSDKSRDISKDFNKGSNPLLQDAGNTSPGDLWSDGVTMWVANSDTNSAKIYAYKLTGECRESGNDFNSLQVVGNHSPSGLWSDGSTMWVLDGDDKKLYAYNQPLSGNASLKSLNLSGVYISTNLFSEAFSKDAPHYTDSEVRYDDAYVVYSTTTSTTVEPTLSDSSAAFNIQPSDADPNTPGHQVTLAEGNNTITITVTAENGNIKQHTVTVARDSGGYTPIKNFNLAIGNSSPIGVWSKGTNMWMANDTTDNVGDRIYAYDKNDTGGLTANSINNISLINGNNDPGGLWSNDTTMWVMDSTDKKIYAYDLLTTNKVRVDTKDFNRLWTTNHPEIDREGLNEPRGFWSDDTTMWVANEAFTGANNSRKIFAYTINDTNLVANTTNIITLDDRNAKPRDIWSNETTMWVADAGEDRIFAYNMWTTIESNRVWGGNHDSNKDIDTSKVSRNDDKGRGIWSDGTTMWVTGSGRKVYAFNLPQSSSGASTNSDDFDDSTLSVLRLSGIELNPVFSPDNLFYTAVVDHTVATTTVTATPNDSEATVDILWASNRASTSLTASRGPRVSLKEGYNIIAVDVTAENGSIQTYLVEVTRSAAPPLSGGPLPQSFRPLAIGNNPTASSSADEGWMSRLMSAETLTDGGVRFVFLVPHEELKIETTPDLLAGEWRPLPDDEFKMIRERNNVDGQVRLTVILPQADGKQRFLRLTTQR